MSTQKIRPQDEWDKYVKMHLDEGRKVKDICDEFEIPRTSLHYHLSKERRVRNGEPALPARTRVVPKRRAEEPEEPKELEPPEQPEQPEEARQPTIRDDFLTSIDAPKRGGSGSSSKRSNVLEDRGSLVDRLFPVDEIFKPETLAQRPPEPPKTTGKKVTKSWLTTKIKTAKGVKKELPELEEDNERLVLVQKMSSDLGDRYCLGWVCTVWIDVEDVVALDRRVMPGNDHMPKSPCSIVNNFERSLHPEEEPPALCTPFLPQSRHLPQARTPVLLHSLTLCTHTTSGTQERIRGTSPGEGVDPNRLPDADKGELREVEGDVNDNLPSWRLEAEPNQLGGLHKFGRKSVPSSWYQFANTVAKKRARGGRNPPD